MGPLTVSGVCPSFLQVVVFFSSLLLSTRRVSLFFKCRLRQRRPPTTTTDHLIAFGLADRFRYLLHDRLITTAELPIDFMLPFCFCRAGVVVIVTTLKERSEKRKEEKKESFPIDQVPTWRGSSVDLIYSI